MKRGDIVYVNLPVVAGSRAQGGRRPAIFLMADGASRGNPMAMIVPLTTRQAAARFPFTLRIEPSALNGLAAPSIALAFQLCAADSTYIDTVLGHLEPTLLERLDESIRLMLGL